MEASCTPIKAQETMTAIMLNTFMLRQYTQSFLNACSRSMGPLIAVRPQNGHTVIFSSSITLTSLPQLLHQRQQLIQILQLVPAFQFADHEVHADVCQQAQLHFFPRQTVERAARCRCVRRKLYAHYCLRASPLYLATSCSTVVPSTRASATPKLRPGYLTPFSTKLTYSCVTPRRCASCACVIFFCSRRSFTSLPNIFCPPFRIIKFQIVKDNLNLLI
nr:MAG TPA: hypothetical protein [Caudoviricetes sp.]